MRSRWGGQTVFRPSGSVPPDFDSRFREAFGRAPGAGAEDGYRAMNGVLRAIAARAGNDGRRVDTYRAAARDASTGVIPVGRPRDVTPRSSSPA